MTVHAIFFDLGGVILRTEYQAPREHLAERLHMTYEDLSKIVFESESSRLASIGAISTEKHWEKVAARLGLPTSETASLRQEFFAGDVVDRQLLDFIRGLRPRHRTAIISNGWPDLRDYICQNGFDDAFDALVISAEAGVMKPEHRIFQIGLEKLNVTAAEAAFVDDTPVNVEAAIRLGMHGIVFESTDQTQREVKTLVG
jgi:putative hydrolase of the HAD superfamily